MMLAATGLLSGSEAAQWCLDSVNQLGYQEWHDQVAAAPRSPIGYNGCPSIRLGDRLKSTDSNRRKQDSSKARVALTARKLFRLDGAAPSTDFAIIPTAEWKTFRVDEYEAALLDGNKLT